MLNSGPPGAWESSRLMPTAPAASVALTVVVPHPDYVRFAAHYGFRPDFCEGAAH